MLMIVPRDAPQVGQGGLRGHIGAKEVHCKHMLSFRHGHLVERCVRRMNAGVVDQTIEATKLIGCRMNDVLKLLAIGDIARQGHCATAAFAVQLDGQRFGQPASRSTMATRAPSA